MPISLSLIGSIRGLLPFSGVIANTLRSVSRCRGVSCVSSPIRIPVSFRVCRMVESFLPVPAMSKSISCSVGMNGSRSIGMYFGAFHGMFLRLRYAE